MLRDKSVSWLSGKRRRTLGRTPAWLLAALLALALTALGSAHAWAQEKIDPALAAKLAALSPDEFVRVIIRMEEQPFVTAAMGPDTVKFLLKEHAQRTQQPVLDFLAQAQVRGDVRVYNSFWIVNAAVAEIRAGAVEKLATLPGVGLIYEEYTFSIEPNERVRQAADAPIWDSYATTFVYDVWELGYKGQGVTIAIADTGIDITHPELAGAMGGVGPFHEGYWAEFDENGFLVPGSMPHDTDTHGTWVASIAAGRSVGGYTVGMAPEATLAGVLVLPGGSGTFAQVLGGLQWVAEQGFDVINGSFGANTINLDMAIATDNLAAAGVVPVFANGNWSPLVPDSYPPATPGNTPSAIAVGGFDQTGESAWYNFGGIIEYPGYEYPDEYSKMKPDISAPGVDVFGARAGGGYYIGGGTSAATPHVAGAVALMLSANPSLTVDEVKQALYANVGGHQQFGWDDFPTKDLDLGWGRLNAFRAVTAVAAPGGVAIVAGTVRTTGEFGDHPVPGATVRFSGPQTREVQTDDTGRFSLQIPEGFYTVSARAPGYRTSERQVAIVAKPEPVEIHFVLEPGEKGGVVGTVWDAATGEPLAGVTVSAGGAEATTAGDGSYLLELVEGSHVLAFEKAGYFAQTRDITVIPNQFAQVDVALVFGHKTLWGTVADEAGNPVAGATVRVAAAGVETSTDAAGAYAVDLPAGEYSVEFAKTGFVTRTVTAVIAHGATTQLNVQLAANTGRLVGTVTNLDGDPVEGAVVAIAALGLQTATGADGRYEFPAVAVGTWRVSVTHEAYYGQAGTVVIEYGKTATHDFVLQPLGGVSPFRNSFDTAEERAAWRLVDYNGNGHHWNFTQNDSVSPPFSAWSGNPSLGYSPANQEVGMISPLFKLPADTPLDLTFQMRGQIWGPWHAFAVFVFDHDAGTDNLVFLHETSTPVPWTEVTVPLAAFAGRTVTVEFYVFTDGLVRTSDVGIYLDDVIVGFVQPELTGRIEGVVINEAGTPVADAAVTVVELAPEGAMVRMSQVFTDADGRFALDVRAGSWTLRAAKAPEYSAAEQIVYVVPGETTTTSITLPANLPPAKVTGLRAQPGDGVVHLSWNANDEDDLAGYNVYRSLDGVHFQRIGSTTETQFTAQGLQNGYTYYFRVTAVDMYGVEGEPAEVEATPLDTAPTVQRFDVQPRTLTRGGAVQVSAELGHPLGEQPLNVRLEATRGDTLVRAWEFLGQSVGEFAATVETTDAFGRPWAPNVYGFTLYVTDQSGAVGRSNTINVALFAPLPQSLSFLLGNNPFNPNRESQRIEFALPSAGWVTVAVYTLDGRLVRTILDEHREAGQHIAFWDGADQRGQTVLAGMYVVRVQFTDANGQRTELTRHSVVVK